MHHQHAAVPLQPGPIPPMPDPPVTPAAAHVWTRHNPLGGTLYTCPACGIDHDAAPYAPYCSPEHVQAITARLAAIERQVGQLTVRAAPLAEYDRILRAIYGTP